MFVHLTVWGIAFRDLRLMMISNSDSIMEENKKMYFGTMLGFVSEAPVFESFEDRMDYCESLKED